MSKLQNRLLKHTEHLQNAIVIGNGFDHLPNILEIFKTVFVFSSNVAQVRAKNIVYRTDLTNLHQLTDISVIFVDRDQVKNLENFYGLWNAGKPMVCIEGSEEISAAESAAIRSARYSVCEYRKKYHIWRRY